MNGLELAKNAVALFRQNNGDASLYLYCQRFDGFYIQSTWAGHWNSTTYASAKIASQVARQNGRIYTTDLNDSRIEAGERVYYEWGQYGHVCAIVGRDSGGLLVSNTANAGDDLGQLGNHVKISHAHTLGLPIIGISSRDGNNPRITGVDMWLPGGNNGGGGGGTPTGDRIALDNWAWYTSADEAVAMRNPHGKRWTGESYMKGDYAVIRVEGNGAVCVRANDGSTVWVHPSARALIYAGSGGGGGNSGTWYFDVPAGGQYYYNKYENALNGNYDASQLIYSGTREVVENPGTGPVRIKANDGTLIWVGTRRNPAAIRQG